MRLLSRRRPDEARMEMTPMIDVTFLLLVFFLATLRFKTLEGRLDAYLPQDAGPNPERSEPVERLDLSIDVVRPGTRLTPRGAPWSPGDGRYRFADDRLVRYRLGPARFESLAELDARLASIAARGGERPPVTLDAGAGVVQAEAVGVLDRLVGHGWTEVVVRGVE